MVAIKNRFELSRRQQALLASKTLAGGKRSCCGGIAHRYSGGRISGGHTGSRWLCVAGRGAIRPSGACDLWRGGGSIRCGRSWWPCAHENRVCACASVRWAGMYACSWCTYLLSGVDRQTPRLGFVEKKEAALYRTEPLLTTPSGLCEQESSIDSNTQITHRLSPSSTLTSPLSPPKNQP